MSGNRGENVRSCTSLTSPLILPKCFWLSRIIRWAHKYHRRLELNIFQQLKLSRRWRIKRSKTHHLNINLDTHQTPGYVNPLGLLQRVRTQDRRDILKQVICKMEGMAGWGWRAWQDAFLFVWTGVYVGELGHVGELIHTLGAKPLSKSEQRVREGMYEHPSLLLKN